MSFTIQRSFYNSAQDRGIWSPSTSTANFCEEDYVVTYYIAEFINTLSNLAYIYYAMYPPTGRLETLGTNKQGTAERTWALDRKARIKPRWDLQSISLVLVGVTSGVFHASMHMLPQFFDESSMYLLAASWIHALLTTTYVDASKKKDSSKELSQRMYRVKRGNHAVTWAALALSLALASIVSHFTGILAIHSIIFALLLVVSGLKLIYLMILATPISGQHGFTLANVFGLSPARKVLLVSLFRAILFLQLAFGLWLLDCNPTVCHFLRYVRNDVLGQFWYLRPFAFLTELHGWWHILTARSAGEYMSLVRLLTTED